jgi:protein-L-isoaspartate O-methyltransferase
MAVRRRGVRKLIGARIFDIALLGFLACAVALAITTPHLHDGDMAAGSTRQHDPPTLTGPQARRWHEVLTSLSEAAIAGTGYVIVDDAAGRAGAFADRLATHLRSGGYPCARLTGRQPAGDEHTDRPIVIADGPYWRAHPPVGSWHLVVWLRTSSPAVSEGERTANVVIDLHDETWPVIRHIAVDVVGSDLQLRETQAFFTAHAADWDTKFGDDLPAYAAVVAEAAIPAGATALDVGCGTGRALPALRRAVGPTGQVIGVDVTAPMLAQARHRRGHAGHLLRADARRLPLADRSIDTVFAAGLVQHLPDPAAGVRELGRVTRSGGRLVIFHPSGRAALAARHGRTLRPDEPLAENPLRQLLAGAGFRLDRYDDPPHRFLALASRV